MRGIHNGSVIRSFFVSLEVLVFFGGFFLLISWKNCRINSRPAGDYHIVMLLHADLYMNCDYLIKYGGIIFPVQVIAATQWSGCKRTMPWWHHQMETFFRFTGHLCGQRPVTWCFDVFFDLRLNKRLSKQSWGWLFETLSHPLWRNSNVVREMKVMLASTLRRCHMSVKAFRFKRHSNECIK